MFKFLLILYNWQLVNNAWYLWTYLTLPPLLPLFLQTYFTTRWVTYKGKYRVNSRGPVIPGLVILPTLSKVSYSKCPGLWSLKNIWLNLQFSLVMSVFKTFFSFWMHSIVNFSHFVFNCQKHNYFCCDFLFGLNLSFVAKLEVGSWISQMDYFMFWWFKPIAFHLILHTQRSLVITNRDFYGLVYEKLLYQQIYDYFNCIFSKYLCGFRKYHSTQHCLLFMAEMLK